MTGEGSEIAGFVQKRGEGLHHLCFCVPDLAKALAEVARSGVRLIDQVPRAGAGGRATAFVHPSSCHGVLVELVEKKPEEK